jgi:hypothetical protein
MFESVMSELGQTCPSRTCVFESDMAGWNKVQVCLSKIPVSSELVMSESDNHVRVGHVVRVGHNRLG